MKVKVYYNSHKKMFSVVSMEKENYGKVIKHTKDLKAINAVFHVGKSGRQKVIREKQKNVHAWIKCILSDVDRTRTWKIVRYNPYHNETFIIIDNNKPIYKCDTLLIIDNVVWAGLPSYGKR